MKYTEAFMLSTDLVKKLKEIYVASIFITILFIYGVIKKSLPTTYISKETYDMAFYVGCGNAILLLSPMVKYNMEQIKIMLSVLLRLLVIGTMVEVTIRSLLNGDGLKDIAVYLLLIVVNVALYKKIGHDEAVKRLVEDAKKKRVRR